MANKKISILIVTITSLIIVTELMLRTVLLIFGYPLLCPANYLRKRYYPFVEGMLSVSQEKGTRNILILGGSVVNTDWSRMDKRLDTLFQNAYPGVKKFNFFNVAMPGHNSLDNLIKYKLLKNQKFDLVIFYEAINETRANNVPTEQFHEDYSHIKWYDELNLLIAHPELNVTVIPYVIHLVSKTVWDKITNREYISNDAVKAEYAVLGKEIKTAKSYYRNVTAIANYSHQKKDPLLLVKYAYFFPDSAELTGESADEKYFTPCHVVSPVTTWGKPMNVKNGIEIHNNLLERISHEQSTYFFDMSKELPKDSTMFCDVCHLSEQGAQMFSSKLSSYIISNALIK